MQRSRWREDSGSAVVEFVVLAVLMLLPIVYLVLALARIEAGAFAVQRAAREAARVFVAAPTDGEGRPRAEAAAAIAFADQGFGPADHRTVVVGCGQPDCHAPDTRVEVRSSLQVVLPGVPRLADRFVPARIEVTARQVATVDRFRAP